jgi:hypothetical protein
MTYGDFQLKYGDTDGSKLNLDIEPFLSTPWDKVEERLSDREEDSIDR